MNPSPGAKGGKGVDKQAGGGRGYTIVVSQQVILVAEDNDDDFVLLRCAFEAAGLPHRLIGVPDGVEAINYLFAEHPYTRSIYPFPDLMVLDMEMPGLDGIGVLAALKDQIEFRALPIVVLSSLAEPMMVRQAFKLGAKDYIVKPMTTAERIKMVQQFDSRWLKNRRRPTRRAGDINTWGIRLEDQKRTHPNKPE